MIKKILKILEILGNFLNVIFFLIFTKVVLTLQI